MNILYIYDIYIYIYIYIYEIISLKFDDIVKMNSIKCMFQARNNVLLHNL